MPQILTDSEIDALIQEKKLLPENFRDHVQLKRKTGHKEAEFTIQGSNGHTFVVVLRQSNFDALNFSAILIYKIPESTAVFILRRYNGNSHEHPNKIEKNKLSFEFHIHIATERYQVAGFDEEAYAISTSEYSDVYGALDCLFRDCGFVQPFSQQGTLPLITEFF